MAGLFGSITIKGNRLTEFASQTATVGVPIPYGFGRFPCEGNVIFAPMPPKEHVKKKKQGKGGVKSEEYSYTLSYAVAFCEGPIFGFLTIKRNGKVVWTQDPNASVDDRTYAAKWKRKATFYYGTETQLPDSTIESYRGVGQVSAFRGIAYIVVEDDDVTDGGGAVPTYEAVVIASPPDAYLTSRPYPSDMAPESLGTTFAVMPGMLRQTSHVGYSSDLVGANVSLAEGQLWTPLVKVNAETDEVQSSISVGEGRLYNPLVSANAEIDTVNAVGIRPLSGVLAVKLITYTYWPAESVNSNITLPSGGYLGV